MPSSSLSSPTLLVHGGALRRPMIVSDYTCRSGRSSRYSLWTLRHWS